jgi:hypothetical protein
MRSLDPNKTKRFHGSLKQLLDEVVTTIKLSKKIRAIFLAAPELTSNSAVDESMKSITKYVCNTLECDRATVYALDHDAGVLWSQVAKGEGKSFTIPLGSGVSGYAA